MKCLKEEISNNLKMLHNMHAEVGDMKPYSNDFLTDLIDYTEKLLEG